MFSGRHLAGRGANLGIDSQDAEALARAIEVEQASEVGTNCATPSGGGVQTADNPIGHLLISSQQ